MKKFYVKVYDAVVGVSTNSKNIVDELNKDVGKYLEKNVGYVDGSIKMVETKGKFPLKIPEYAIRESFLPPDSASYVYSGLKFLEKKNQRIVKADWKNNSVVGYFRPKYKVSSLIRFLLKWVIIRALENHQVFYIHGSGVAKNGSALLFIGPTGFGKTSTLITFLQNGYKLITDDTILIRNNEILPFHMRSMIHKDMLKRFPFLKKCISKESTYIALPPQKGWLVNLEKIYPAFYGKIKSAYLFYVYVWNSKKTKLENISKKEMVSRLLYTYFNEISNSVWFGWEKETLTKKLFSTYAFFAENVECYRLFVGSSSLQLLKTVEEIV